MKVSVLGDGITGSAVKAFLKTDSNYEESALEFADLVVVSPGIPPSKYPSVVVEIISEIEFAIRILNDRHSKPKIIGVTGTNGKTTVVTGIASLLGVSMFGNIGTPLISAVNSLGVNDTIIIELSSYQLYSSKSLECDIAIIINITPDHLDWHKTFEAYKQAKLSIINSNKHQTIYCPKEDQSIVHKLKNENSEIQIIDELPMCKINPFFGNHNKINISIIKAVSKQMGICDDTYNSWINSFKMPEYRCEEIFNSGYLKVINDSKSTNMDSTLSAVNSIEGEQILILAGKPKESFSIPWAQAIVEKCKYVYACGYLAENKGLFPEVFKGEIVFFSTVKQAVEHVLTYHKKGTILFSPAGASFDEFKNYEERGRAFNQYVKENMAIASN